MRVFWSIPLVGLAACGFNPHPQNGVLPCDKGCPSGYHCAKDGTCRTTEVGSGGVTASGGLTGFGGIAGSGGLTVPGGTTGRGGVVGSGGVFASGGLTGSGGIAGSGGLVGSGGTTGAGGVVGTGGIVGTGGTVGTGRDWSVCSPQDRCQTGYTCTADWKCVLVGSGGTTGTGGVVGTGGIVNTGGTVGAGGTIVPELAVFAGVPSGQGSADGTGAAARFWQPFGVAVDGAGNVFVTDLENNTIRKITPSGVVTTLAGTAGSYGSADGTGAAALFHGPSGVAVDGSGNVFVADAGNNTIRKITPGGVVTTLAGTAGLSGSADGTGAAARFKGPSGVAVDGSGNVFVGDYSNYTIRKITPSGVVTTLAGTAGSWGSADGTGAAARFNGLAAVAVDGSDNVFVADSWNSAIRKITPSGVVTTLVSAGYPEGVAVDGSGNVFFADHSNTIRKITPSGVVTTLAGSADQPGSADGTGAAALFYWPAGVAVDGSGNVFVADDGNNTIRKITPSGVVTTLAGSADQRGSADGTGAAARFNGPDGVAVDGSGNVFVADAGNSTIRKITPGGVVTTLAGTAGSYGGADGTGAAALFNEPEGVAVDGSGNVFVADAGKSSTIRKITPSGVVTTLAGTAGLSGSADGTGAAASFSFPSGVAVDGSGNVFVADGNTIRKITPSGVVTTIVGAATRLGAGNSQGPLPASILSPVGVAIDASTGKLYITLPDAVMVADLPK